MGGKEGGEDYDVSSNYVPKKSRVLLKVSRDLYFGDSLLLQQFCFRIIQTPIIPEYIKPFEPLWTGLPRFLQTSRFQN